MNKLGFYLRKLEDQTKHKTSRMKDTMKTRI